MTTFETTAPALAAAAKSAAGLSPNSGKPGRIVAVKTRSDGDENVRLEARTITSVVNYAVDVTDEWYLKGKPHVHGQVKLTLSRRDHKGSIKTSGTDDYATFLFQWIALWASGVVVAGPLRHIQSVQDGPDHLGLGRALPVDVPRRASIALSRDSD